MVEVTIATTENQMDPHAVTACLPCVRKGERLKEKTREDTFTITTTVVTVLTQPTPPTHSPRASLTLSGTPSQRNYAKSPTRKIRDTTSRRVPTCCIVISENLRVQLTCVFKATVRSRSHKCRKRSDGSRSFSFMPIAKSMYIHHLSQK